MLGFMLEQHARVLGIAASKQACMSPPSYAWLATNSVYILFYWIRKLVAETWFGAASVCYDVTFISVLRPALHYLQAFVMSLVPNLHSYILLAQKDFVRSGLICLFQSVLQYTLEDLFMLGLAARSRQGTKRQAVCTTLVPIK